MTTPTIEELRAENDRLRARAQELLEANTTLTERYRARSRRHTVTDFHVAIGAPVHHTPHVPSDARVRLRLRLIAEEFLELLEACLDIPDEEAWNEFAQVTLDAAKVFPVRVDLPEAVDALADLDYVIEGTRLEFGVDGELVHVEVHAANMRKLGGPVDEHGKQRKPDGWTPPDIRRVLLEQGWRP
jgi:predicted HAD superfamily Cof-like phosphohydrolase